MLSIETARTIKAGDDTTGPFTVANGANGIYINTEAELVVTHVTSAGVETTYTNPTHYSVNGTVPSAALSLTTVSAVATGDFLVIERRSVHTQTLDLEKGANFSGANVEEAIDALTRQVQDLRAIVDRVARLNPADTDGSGGYDLNENNLLKAGFLELGEQSAPSTPASGYGRIYFDTSGNAYFLNDAGTSTNVTSSATAAAASAATASSAATTAQAAANFSTTPSLTYDYDSGTTTGCATGEIRFDNAAFASITSFFIHETSSLQGAYGAFLDTWDDSTSTIKGHARFYDPEDPDNWVILAVTGAQTDNGTDRTFPVSFVASSGSMFADGTDVHVHFDRNGDGGGIASVASDTSPQAGGDFDMNSHMMQWSKGTDVGAGTALTLSTDGNSFDIVGSVTIESIATVGVGTFVTLKFNNAPLLTHHATNLILPNSENIQAASGDVGVFYEYASGDWRLVSWQPAAHSVVAASATAPGPVELATAAETNTGTDAVRALTPDGFAGSNYGTAVVSVLVFDDATDVATGDGAGDIFYRIPSTLNGFNLVAVAASVRTAGTTGTTDVQVHNITDTADMLSTVITIDSGETDTSTAAAAAEIDAAADDVATGDIIRIDVDAVSTTAPKGLLVELHFRLP